MTSTTTGRGNGHGWDGVLGWVLNDGGRGHGHGHRGGRGYGQARERVYTISDSAGRTVTLTVCQGRRPPGHGGRPRDPVRQRPRHEAGARLARLRVVARQGREPPGAPGDGQGERDARGGALRRQHGQHDHRDRLGRARGERPGHGDRDRTVAAGAGDLGRRADRELRRVRLGQRRPDYGGGPARAGRLPGAGASRGCAEIARLVRP